eukprot:1936226-Rhodomonas_salina.5
MWSEGCARGGAEARERREQRGPREQRARESVEELEGARAQAVARHGTARSVSGWRASQCSQRWCWRWCWDGERVGGGMLTVLVGVGLLIVWVLPRW